MSKISDSIITLALKKCGYFISSYPSKIIFGEVKEFKYPEKKAFIFERFQFEKVYDGICNILKSLIPTNPQKGTIIEISEISYFWNKISGPGEDIFQLGIKNFDDTVFVDSFTLIELNHLFHCFNELLFSSILLRDFEIEFFQTILTLPLKEIVAFASDDVTLIKYLKANFPQNIYNSKIIIQNNIDIILFKYKLNSLVKQDILMPNLSSAFLN